MLDFLKKAGIPTITFWFLSFRQNDKFCIFRAVLKKHDFEFNILLRVRLRIKKIETFVRFFIELLKRVNF